MIFFRDLKVWSVYYYVCVVLCGCLCFRGLCCESLWYFTTIICVLYIVLMLHVILCTTFGYTYIRAHITESLRYSFVWKSNLTSNTLVILISIFSSESLNTIDKIQIRNLSWYVFSNILHYVLVKPNCPNVMQCRKMWAPTRLKSPEIRQFVQQTFLVTKTYVQHYRSFCEGNQAVLLIQEQSYG